MTGLKITLKCIIGVLPVERKKAQKVKIKLAFSSENFIDYAPIISLINKQMKKRKFSFLEEACEFFAKKIQKKYPNIKKFKIKISKPELHKIHNLGSKAKPYAELKKIY